MLGSSTDVDVRVRVDLIPETTYGLHSAYPTLPPTEYVIKNKTLTAPIMLSAVCRTSLLTLKAHLQYFTVVL
jgi:hypothetical protein